MPKYGLAFPEETFPHRLYFRDLVTKIYLFFSRQVIIWACTRAFLQNANFSIDDSHFVNATVTVGDGSQGLPEAAPFDAVLVSAAYTAVPAPLAAQLVEGGRLVQPVGPGGAEQVVLFERSEGDLLPRRTVADARFVRLVGTHGFAER